MYGPRAFTISLLLTAAICAQTSAPAGVSTEWDVKQQMMALATDVRKLDPLLGGIDPKQWVDQGAPAAYVRQLESVKGSAKGLISATDQLALEPEKLAVALDAFFQMERMELLGTSLKDGLRKYQSGDLADRLNRAFAANVIHRDRLRQHIRDLAAMREQEYQIASEEAQRCRVLLTKPTPPPERKSGKSHNQSPSPK